MPVYLHHIETLVPEQAYSQEFARERMEAWVEGDKQRRLVRRVYRNSGIETRYSTLDDFRLGSEGTLFKTDANGRIIEPGTRERNDRFSQEARKMAGEVARRALTGSSHYSAADITHVITVTCTGFSNPGPDFHIVREANLSASTQRYALGFMGCYAALPALRMASQFCQADPSAVVLIVSIELCSLHLHFENGIDSLLGNAIFGDGAAAALVSARLPSPERPAYCLDGFASTLIPSAEKDMAWLIGNKGFEITLSTYVPEVIGAHIREIVDRILLAHKRGFGDIALWAVHPGGKAILDKVQSELQLTDDQIRASRTVLRRYGNMSSATSLFVLKEILDSAAPGSGRDGICAIAFGPGLTVETALLQREPATASKA